MIFLVGAGPGDPGLLTVRAAVLLEKADVILYDALVSSAIVSLASPRAQRITVGKRAIKGSVHQRNPPCRTTTRRDAAAASQDEINALLVRLGREQPGATIVRLKGGDPFVFGRGGEEALALVEAGIGFEVVPGVSSAIAAPAYAGIPVTHRGKASSVTFITAQNDATRPREAIDFDALARFDGTLVFMMGVNRLPEIASELIRLGRSPATRAAIIQWGTCPNQFVVSDRLDGIAAAAERSGLGSPSVLVVGAVAELRDQLKWFENRPLFGRRVLVTRMPDSRGELAARLSELGAEVIGAPAIRIRDLDPGPLDAALARMAEFTDLLLTSRTTVRILAERIEASGRDGRALAGVRLTAIGPGTAAELKERLGLRADLVPESSSAEGVLAALGETAGRRFLFPRAKEARDLIPEALGSSVRVIAAYETVPDESVDLDALVRGEIDIALFASSSAVRALAAAITRSGADPAALMKSARVISIGPATTASLKECGINAETAARSDLDGLIAACLKSDG